MHPRSSLIIQLSEAKARVAQLELALTRIANIENADYGPDWQEIEEARAIARTALYDGVEP